MSALPTHPSFIPPHGEAAFGPGRASRTIGASQRASLGRGLAFVLLLAASLLTSVYVPVALHGADWVEGTGTAQRPGSP